MKYVLVSGGVISGIGKGIIASSTGLLLKTLGLKVSSIKVDPYMNIDAGTMSPTEHGEVFVLDDGGEVDLDLGNYERYLNITLTRNNNITTGKIYQHVIEKERKGHYLGKTVQVVPHLTDATQDWIEEVARVPVDDTNEEPDVCIIELGGTVGDIESAPFIEALRQLRDRVGEHDFLNIHVSLVPVINDEQKTKPTQAAIKDARSSGLQPDLIACRCVKPLEDATTEKIAKFCSVKRHQVVAVHDVSSTYHVPELLETQGLIPLLTDILRLDTTKIPKGLAAKGAKTWEAWKSLTNNRDHLFQSVKIVLVGKYTKLHDSYLSVIKSLEHSAMACGHTLDLRWVESDDLEPQAEKARQAKYHEAWHEVCTAQGILVPGGFGTRGVEGMIKAANYARTHNVPYLGICLGMQLAVIEYARNVCGINDAGSEEMDMDNNPRKFQHIVKYMPEIDKSVMGGNMRLGLRATIFQEGSEWSKLRALYTNSPSHRPTKGVKVSGHGEVPSLSTENGTENSKTPAILERHRHRYEVNPDFIDQLAEKGLHFVGKDDKGERMEVIELKDHPWYVGVQFHPEYLSRVLEPSKPYLGFVAASAGCLDETMKKLKQKEAQLGADGSVF